MAALISCDRIVALACVSSPSQSGQRARSSHYSVNLWLTYYQIQTRNLGYV